jgi:hypothetical protein
MKGMIVKTKCLLPVWFLLAGAIAYGAQASPQINFGNNFVHQIQMTGTAAWHYGSDEQTGTVTLTAAASGASRVELHLARGNWVETQGALTDPDRTCTQQGFDGVVHQIAAHNCFLGAVWFLPQITLQPGAGAKDGVTVSAGTSGTGNARLHHERHVSRVRNASTASLIARLSAVDVELDAAGRPTVLYFNSHPETDAGLDLPTDVHFSDYRLVQGEHVPFHIQKFVNNTLVLDLQISEVSFQPGAAPLQ